MKQRKVSAIIISIILVVCAVSMMGCDFFKSVSADEAKANLQNAGYTIAIEMSGNEFDRNKFNLTSGELEKYIYAYKGDDKIHIYVFRSIADAENNYSFMIESNLLGGQSNEIVYFATKQARKDAQF